jgi:hypothetical protein
MEAPLCCCPDPATYTYIRTCRLKGRRVGAGERGLMHGFTLGPPAAEDVLREALPGGRSGASISVIQHSVARTRWPRRERLRRPWSARARSTSSWLVSILSTAILSKSGPKLAS